MKTVYVSDDYVTVLTEDQATERILAGAKAYPCRSSYDECGICQAQGGKIVAVLLTEATEL